VFGEDVGLASVFDWCRHGRNVTRGYTNARKTSNYFHAPNRGILQHNV
jgi:hypothetical protein